MKKHSKQKKKQIRLFKNIPKYFLDLRILMLLVIGACLLVGGIILSASNMRTYHTRVIANLPKPTILPTPTATPTATLTPTPVYTGFCMRVPVLLYHHIQSFADATSHGQSSLSVDTGVFDGQMAEVASRYTTISAQQLVDALKAHTTLPSNAMVVTFDDGYLDIYTNAYPILQKYHIVASLMIPTGLLGATGNNTYMDWGELKQMVGSGSIFAYDHTWSHYPVGSGSPDKDQYEILTAKQQLESNLGKPVTIFTNPYGSGENNPRVVAELEQDGFSGAFSTIPGSYQCDSFIYSLHRTRIGNTSLSSYGL